MKKKFTFFSVLFLLLFGYSKAQNYVTIPDANFVKYLKTNFSTCMNGNQLDTTCQAIMDAKSMMLYWQGPISNLYGIQFFKNLEMLTCRQLELETLPALPPKLYYLYCDSNKLVTLPALPKDLYILTCNENKLENLPALPNKLNTLVCSNNMLQTLPVFSKELKTINCSYNMIKKLPDLPDTLDMLTCNNNQLTELPKLGNALRILYCGFNQLSTLPTLPPILKDLSCGNNLLTSLPVFPFKLYYLSCPNNTISCFQIFPPLVTIDISNNPFKCLPNYITAMDASTLAYPLCKTGDKLNNPDGCVSAVRIKGSVYQDLNSNCKKDITDTNPSNISLKLYDSSNKQIGQTYSNGKGEFDFFVPAAATYKVVLDTTALFADINCPFPGNDTVVVLSNTGVDNIDFNLMCKPGFDIGVQSICPTGKVFPGQYHRLTISAGDINKSNNLGCKINMPGTVQVTVDGPVSYSSPALGSLTPVVSGNVFTYNISNFATIDWNAFILIFSTNTTATVNDSVCVSVVVTPVKGDFNPNNNIKHYCYKVFNSYDPNLKEVYPLDKVKPGFNDWFTYTLHFQNTGNSPAMDIVLRDTLDTKLDLETFQLLSYSHPNKTSLTGNAIEFKFPDIQLADSVSNPEGSKGFIQYRIKPKANLPGGSIIYNRAFIYFDYNPPVITNTTVNLFVKTISVDENGISPILIYPNPSKGIIHLEMGDKMPLNNLNVYVYNIIGKIVWNAKITAKNTVINLDEVPSGVYFLRVTGMEQSFTQRLIKQ